MKISIGDIDFYQNSSSMIFMLVLYSNSSRTHVTVRPAAAVIAPVRETTSAVFVSGIPSQHNSKHGSFFPQVLWKEFSDFCLSIKARSWDRLWYESIPILQVQIIFRVGSPKNTVGFDTHSLLVKPLLYDFVSLIHLSGSTV
jgi:hypothetical protein